jgi:hypothetical protein
MALGLAVWVTDFDLAGLGSIPHPRTVSSTTSFDERFGPGSVRRSLASTTPGVRGPLEFRCRNSGHIESPVGRTIRERSRTFSPRRPPDRRGAIPLPRARPVLANLQSARSDPASVSSDNRTMFEKLADLVPMSFSLASLTPGDGCSASERI